MDSAMLSIEQVAEHLRLHVKTVRNYVREGRLKAVRIGKQYRIAASDLAAMMGRPVSALIRRQFAGPGALKFTASLKSTR